MQVDARCVGSNKPRRRAGAAPSPNQPATSLGSGKRCRRASLALLLLQPCYGLGERGGAVASGECRASYASRTPAHGRRITGIDALRNASIDSLRMLLSMPCEMLLSMRCERQASESCAKARPGASERIQRASTYICTYPAAARSALRHAGCLRVARGAGAAGAAARLRKRITDIV